MLSKLTSRKFLLSAAAFLGSLGASIAGIAIDNTCVATIGIICSFLSAAIYAGVEGSVDKAAVNTTVTIEENESEEE